MRLIDADALIAKAYIMQEPNGFIHSVVTERQIVAAPTIKAEPVRHGRWVDHMCRDWRCSECGEKINKVRNVDGYCYDDKPNYCPHCGARMQK